MSASHHVLVTNDDGIDSPGLHELAIQIEQAGFDVIIAAPSYDASGVGASLGSIAAERPIPLQRRSIAGFHGHAYALDAPPATCVLIGQLGAFGPDIDVVVSGINDGLNTGRSVLHSGTVGAVLAAQNFGLRGLAVSIPRTEPLEWRTAANLAVTVLASMQHAPLRCAVNLNVPALSSNDVKGIRWGRLASYNAVRSTMRHVEDDHVVLALVPPPHPPEEDTDLAQVRHGYASLTSLHAGNEVWSDSVQPCAEFDPKIPIPAVAAGDKLTPARAFLR